MGALRHAVHWQTTSQKVTTEATCPTVAAGSGGGRDGGPSARVIWGQSGRAQRAEGYLRFVPPAQPGWGETGASFKALPGAVRGREHPVANETY